MWQSNWNNVPLEEIPIGHVTNGIHIRSWTSYEMSELLLRYLGPNWLKKPADQSIWERVDRIPDVELWRAHERRRERLVAFARKRLVKQMKRRGASAREIENAGEVLNPEALTIGFARRFATYKRATLLLKDFDRLKKIIRNKEKPIQFIFAGKAHPRDSEGKELIKQLIHAARDEDIRRHFVFLENYDVNVARYLVEGVDIWMNNPRRPMEASGTSGMKILPNGGLNLSILDGWWCEGYETDTGWAIGAGEDYDDPIYQDEVESKNLYDVLEHDVIPLFYDRKGDNPPRGWISKMKASMRKLCPVFSTNRMVQEYTEDFYTRAFNNWSNLSSNSFGRTKRLAEWKNRIRNNWIHVKINNAVMDNKNSEVGTALKVTAEINLGILKSEEVKVQIYVGSLDTDRNVINNSCEEMKCIDTIGEGMYKYEGFIACDESGLFGYSVRIMPFHQDMADRFDLEMMRWIGDEIIEGEKSSQPERKQTVTH
jgi:starch phosphorylase